MVITDAAGWVLPACKGRGCTNLCEVGDVKAAN